MCSAKQFQGPFPTLAIAMYNIKYSVGSLLYKLAYNVMHYILSHPEFKVRWEVLGWSVYTYHAESAVASHCRLNITVAILPRLWKFKNKWNLLGKGILIVIFLPWPIKLIVLTNHFSYEIYDLGWLVCLECGFQFIEQSGNLGQNE